MNENYKNICMMIHPGRVGSTVVVESLGNIPVYLGGEIYNQTVNNIADWESKWGYIDLFKNMMNSSLNLPLSPYGSILKYTPSLSTYLFEYKPFHSESLPLIDKAIDDFENNGVTQYIFLYRKNYLRRYISCLTALKSGVWHTAISPTHPTKIILDINDCADWDIGFKGGNLLASIDHYYNNFIPSIISSIRNRKHLILTYEDHVEQDVNVAFKLINDFFGEDEMVPVDRGYKKQNNFPLKDIIENYDQVVNMLMSSEYEHFLF